MSYYVYKITNLVNSKFYIGVHKTKLINDGYMGSGIAIKKAIVKYGIDNFSKTILFQFETAKEAYLKESELVDMTDPASYNINNGGQGGFDFINTLDFPKPMHNPETVRRVVEASKITRAKNPEKYREISRANLRTSHAKRLGQKDTVIVRNKRADSLRRYYKNNTSALLGTKKTEKQKENMSRGWTEEKRLKKSEQQKQRISENPDCVRTNTGKKFSTETKEKMSTSAAARRKILRVCPHCNREMNMLNLRRWHLNNCPLLKLENTI